MVNSEFQEWLKSRLVEIYNLLCSKYIELCEKVHDFEQLNKKIVGVYLLENILI